MIQEHEILKRKIKDGFIFFSPDRKFRSKTYKTREDRDKQITKFVEKYNKSELEIIEKRKHEKELLKQY